jgi:hypothetical protein
MSDTTQTHDVVSQGAAVTMASRPNDRNVQVPPDLPGIVIFLHGVNDPGATYETVEKGLCQGLNERLSRSDLAAGAYGERYHAAQAAKNTKKKQSDVLYDPDSYLYQRSEKDSTHSVFIPFYWGYRAGDKEIAKVNQPGKVISRDADASGNLMTRGQYQDTSGNRLDAHFAKEGGFFDNATNCIQDMYGAGFKANRLARTLTETGASGAYTYIGDSPERRYFVLAAHRLAMLVSTIRGIQARTAGSDPADDTITIMGHSQGTIITLLAQALLVKQGHRCADCAIMVDTPYSVRETDGSLQTAHSKLKTFVDIVNEVTKQPHTIPQLAELLCGHDLHGGRTGANWTPTQGKRKDKNGNWITFDERDNRGKVYLYFCPEDTVVALDNIQGIGTFGMPDTIQQGKTTLPAMNTLKDKRFYQRMWTRMERDHDFDGKYKPVLIGTAPARVAVRDQFERLSAGPDSGMDLLVGAATTTSHTRNEMRFINGEELKPPYAPDMYGGEVIKGGPSPGHADQAGKVAPDEVSKDVALGNQYAGFKWINVGSTMDESDVDKFKAQFNAKSGGDINDQSQNWSALGTPEMGYTVMREETPNEARARMQHDKGALSDNNYHSGILASTENHRWVTAMDVAIGQAATLDDPTWRDLLIQMAGWRFDRAALFQIKGNANYGRLSDEAKSLIEATAKYYQFGNFPPESVVPVKTMPSLVTNETRGNT